MKKLAVIGLYLSVLLLLAGFFFKVQAKWGTGWGDQLTILDDSDIISDTISIMQCGPDIIITNDGKGGAVDYNGPPAAEGLPINLFAEEDEDFVFDPDDGDRIRLIDGTLLDAGDSIKSAAITNAVGARITLVAHDDTYWWVHNQVGVWVDNGP